MGSPHGFPHRGQVLCGEGGSAVACSSKQKLCVNRQHSGTSEWIPQTYMTESKHIFDEGIKLKQYNARTS